VARKVSNLLALAVLSYLTQRPMHPYELSRTLREHGDSRSIKFNHGSLYMVVQQLAKAGFVAEQETSREGQRPERTVYAITDTGRAELRDWMRDLVEHPQHEYPQFVAALSLIAALPPSEVLPLLRRRLERLATQRDEIRALVDRTLATGVPPLFLVEEEFRLALLEAESAFVERFIAQTTDPQDGWGRQWAQFHGEPAPGGTQAGASGGDGGPQAAVERATQNER
jgi:DNA-binding PadR family transcriptional regulator